MKCHYPDVFACALLNAQPMGFYSAGDDRRGRQAARRRGPSRRRAATATGTARWKPTRRPGGTVRFAIRMGLRYVKGLGRGALGADRSGARASGRSPRSRISSSARGLDEGTLTRLAEAGALAGFDAEPPRRAVGGAGRGAHARARRWPCRRRERTPRFDDAGRLRDDRLGLPHHRPQPARPPAGAAARAAARAAPARRPHASTPCATAGACATRAWSSAASGPAPPRAWSS